MKNVSSLLKSMKFPSGQSVVLIDVGARWGVNPPWNQVDNKYISYIGFEPDEKECAELTKKHQGENITYFPLGLSDKEADSQLYITKEPGCSSIYKPNKSRMDKYYLSDRWDIKKTVPIKLVPLTQVLEKIDIEPDVIKIDVQGAAYKVLKGAEKNMSKALLIEVEVEFCEMYEGEVLFSQVDMLARENGFELLDMNKYYAKRKILNERHVTRGQVLFADVIYVVSADKFFSQNMPEDECRKKLWNLVLILCVYGHFDLALEFVFHPGATLKEEEQYNIKRTILAHTAIPTWKLWMFNNSLVENTGFILALIANMLRIKGRTFGWGSDQGAVDCRYKYYFSNSILKLFRK